MKETLEEAALNFAITIQTKEGTVSRLNAIEWFKAGAKSDAAKDYWYKKFWEDYESQFKNQEDGND